MQPTLKQGPLLRSYVDNHRTYGLLYRCVTRARWEQHNSCSKYLYSTLKQLKPGTATPAAAGCRPLWKYSDLQQQYSARCQILWHTQCSCHEAVPGWACCLFYVAAALLPPRLPRAERRELQDTPLLYCCCQPYMACAATQNTPIELPDTVCKSLLPLEAHLHSPPRVLRASRGPLLICSQLQQWSPCMAAYTSTCFEYR
jgi:hypothetical protein